MQMQIPSQFASPGPLRLLAYVKASSYLQSTEYGVPTHRLEFLRQNGVVGQVFVPKVPTEYLR
jgi:hypothetical protein